MSAVAGAPPHLRSWGSTPFPSTTERSGRGTFNCRCGRFLRALSSAAEAEPRGLVLHSRCATASQRRQRPCRYATRLCRQCRVGKWAPLLSSPQNSRTELAIGGLQQRMRHCPSAVRLSGGSDGGASQVAALVTPVDLSSRIKFLDRLHAPVMASGATLEKLRQLYSRADAEVKRWAALQVHQMLGARCRSQRAC